jgi:hypothetical protein
VSKPNYVEFRSVVSDENSRFGEAMSSVCADKIVREVVGSHRRQGNKIETAFEYAGAVLGVSPRWVRGVLRQEYGTAMPGKVARLRARYRAWLIADTERLEREIAERRALLLAMETSNAHELVEGENPQFVARTSGSAQAAARK